MPGPVRIIPGHRLLGALPPECTGHDADDAMKRLAQRGIGFIADLLRDVGQRPAGPAQQQSGAKHPPAGEIFERRVKRRRKQPQRPVPARVRMETP